MKKPYHPPGYRERRRRKAENHWRRRVLYPNRPDRYEAELMEMFKQPDVPPGPSQEIEW